jgi:hypothetical protein
MRRRRLSALPSQRRRAALLWRAGFRSSRPRPSSFPGRRAAPPPRRPAASPHPRGPRGGDQRQRCSSSSRRQGGQGEEVHPGSRGGRAGRGSLRLPGLLRLKLSWMPPCLLGGGAR